MKFSVENGGARRRGAGDGRQGESEKEEIIVRPLVAMGHSVIHWLWTWKNIACTRRE